MVYDCLIVGAGWAGCVLAERLANGLGQKVLLVERSNHIGGNAHDFVDAHGLVVQSTVRTSSTPASGRVGLCQPVHDGTVRPSVLAQSQTG